MKNPKKGQYVLDKHYKTKKIVQAVPRKGSSLYFIGSDHEPVSRNEFIFPLPIKKQAPKKKKKTATKKNAKKKSLWDFF